MLTFYPSRIPDPGVKKAPDPGSATLLIAVFQIITATEAAEGVLVPGVGTVLLWDVPPGGERLLTFWSIHPLKTGTGNGTSFL